MSIHRQALLVSCVAMALVPAQAYAQAASTAAADAAPTTDNEIIVTAERRSQSINSVPASIAAATGDQLRSQGINSVADLQKIVPGLRFAQGTYAAPIYTIRGVGFNDSSLGAKSAVSLAIDDVPIAFPIMSAGLGLDVARVEVLKGPQGTLYGQNSTGGAINYVSVRPTQTLEAGANLSYGRFNEVKLEGFVSGPLSSTLAARVAVGLQRSDGWQTNFTRSDRQGGKDFIQGRVLVDWTPSEDFKAQLSFNAYRNRNETQAAQLIGIAPLNPVAAPIYVPSLLTLPHAPENARAADWDAGVSLRQDSPFYLAALRMDYRASDSLTLTSISSYSHYTENRTQDPDGTNLHNIRYHTDARIEVISQELRLMLELDKLRWIVGGNYERDDVSQTNFITFPLLSNSYSLAFFGPPFFTSQDISNQRFNTYGVFTSADYDLTDQLSVRAGIRYTKANIDYSGCTADGGDGALGLLFTGFANFLRAGLPAVTPIAKGGCITLNDQFVPQLVRTKFDQDNVSWRAGLDWKPDAQTLLYGVASKGYKSGSFPNLSASASNQVKPVSQESVMAYEVGLKRYFPGARLQFNTAVFHYNYHDKQLRGKTVVTAFGALDTLVNVPRATIKGVEISGTWTGIPGVTANFGGTYIESRIGKGFSNYEPFGTIENFGGQSIPLTPKWQLYADLQYEWNLNGSTVAFVGTNVSHQSRTNGGLGEKPLLVIKPYTLLDLRAGIHDADDKWSLSVWGRNVTNAYYWSNADRVADTVVRFAGMPATYGFSVSYKYQ